MEVPKAANKDKAAPKILAVAMQGCANPKKQVFLFENLKVLLIQHQFHWNPFGTSWRVKVY